MADTHSLSRAGIPRYALYGEPPRQFDERFIHIEQIAERSRPRGWLISPHMHEDLHQVIVLLDGDAEIHADERYRHYPAPALLIVPAGFVHTFKFRDETHGYVLTASDTFVCSLKAHQPAVGELFQQARGIRLTDSEVRHYELQTTASMLLRDLHASVPARGILVEARAQILLAQVARLVVGGGTRTTQTPFPQARAESTVDEFRRLIELHFHEGWPLKRYADEMRISVAQLRCNCIKATGNTPIKLLHERILREAKRSLRYTLRSITQIAYDLGFHDSAYFSRFFRARCGITPTEFRRSLRLKAGERPQSRAMLQDQRQ